MTADTFPYRFVAEDGMYEGTTFVYLDHRTVISYQTDSPTCYFRSVSGGLREIGEMPGRYDMTPDALARFEAIPVREETSSAMEGLETTTRETTETTGETR